MTLAHPLDPDPRAAARWLGRVDLMPVVPLVDDVACHHDPVGWYVETFWLSTLGPSSTWVVRRLGAALGASPAGVVVDVEAFGASLGLKGVGSASPLRKALARCVAFRVASVDLDRGALEVRRRLPSATARQVERMPAPLRELHDAWRADHGAVAGPWTGAVNP